MNAPSPRHRLRAAAGRLLRAGALAAALAAAPARDCPPEQAIRDGLAAAWEGQQQLEQHLADLSSPSFATREAASAALLELPVLPIDRIERDSAATESAEVRARLRILRRRRSAKLSPAFNRLLGCAESDRPSGCLAPLLDFAATTPATPAIRRALRACAAPGDRDALLRQLAPEFPAARRRVALDALEAALGPDDAPPELLRCLGDPDPGIRLAAARLALNRGRREALEVLAALVDEPSAGPGAARFLEAATGARHDSAAAWRAWLRGDGRAAALQLPVPERPALEAGLRLRFTFDEDPDGQVLDSSGHGHHGQRVGAVRHEDGVRGKAARFSSTRTYLLVDHPGLDPNGWEGLTVACWIKLARHRSRNRVLQRGEVVGEGSGAYHLTPGGSLFGSGDWKPGSSFGTVTGPGQGDAAPAKSLAAGTRPLPPLNQWMHLAATYDGEILRWFVDGNPDGQKAHRFGGPLWEPPGRKLVIGNVAIRSRMRWTDYHFDGWIDELRIWDRAITPEEITELVRRDRSP